MTATAQPAAPPSGDRAFRGCVGQTVSLGTDSGLHALCGAAATNYSSVQNGQFDQLWRTRIALEEGSRPREMPERNAIATMTRAPVGCGQLRRRDHMRSPCGVAAVGSFALLTVLVQRGAAQRPIRVDPNSPRPALLTSAVSTDVLNGVMQLYLSEVVLALQRGDTLALNVLVPNDVIPVAERFAARSATCQSLGEVLMRLRSHASAGPGLSSPIAIGATTFSAVTVADTLMRGTADLLSSGKVVTLTMVMTRSGHARRMAGVRGLLGGLCGLLQ